MYCPIRADSRMRVVSVYALIACRGDNFVFPFVFDPPLLSHGPTTRSHEREEEGRKKGKQNYLLDKRSRHKRSPLSSESQL